MTTNTFSNDWIDMKCVRHQVHGSSLSPHSSSQQDKHHELSSAYYKLQRKPSVNTCAPLGKPSALLPNGRHPDAQCQAKPNLYSIAVSHLSRPELHGEGLAPGRYKVKRWKNKNDVQCHQIVIKTITKHSKEGTYLLSKCNLKSQISQYFRPFLITLRVLQFNPSNSIFHLQECSTSSVRNTLDTTRARAHIRNQLQSVKERNAV